MKRAPRSPNSSDLARDKGWLLGRRRGLLLVALSPLDHLTSSCASQGQRNAPERTGIHKL
jgi:hypothetical protein